MKPLILLGGTFDPFHLSHLYLARQAAADFGGNVRVLPNGNPQHRTAPVASWQQRLAMCRLALAGDEAVEVGEEDSPTGAGYTATTLADIRQQYADVPLLLIVGSDSYLSFQHWYQPRKILQLAHLLVAPRPPLPLPATLPMGEKITDKAALATGSGGVYLWRCQPPMVSASACRAALSTGGDVSTLLPAAVAAYIAENNLYRQ